ncbi:MAG: response regulator transcription factor [Chloroflexota bacterium]|nr:response regulator transcription factor [Chloroflexota bacterium]
MPQRIRVLIVDDQTLVREGFRKLLELEPDVEVVGTAGDGEEALAAAERLHAAGTLPDVILMDIRMPRMDGIAATKALKERWPDAHVVILTTFDDVELIHAGLHAGALGYILKDITAEQLMSTIRTAAKGQVLLQAEVAQKVFAALTPNAASNVPPLPSASTRVPSPSSPSLVNPLVEQLTEREREILALVAQGASNRQIGEALFITEGTVKNHLSNILSKMGVRDRTQAALKAKELGLA